MKQSQHGRAYARVEKIEDTASRISGQNGGIAGIVLSLRLFGAICVLKSGQPIALPASRKARGLLAYLVMARRPILRTRLCEVFWDVPNDPRGELRWCLSKLRRVLDEGLIKRVRADRESVWIDTSHLEVDALMVDRDADEALAGTDLAPLERLVGLIDDEFLDGLESERDPHFQVWLAGQRGRYRTLSAKLHRRISDLLPNLSEARLKVLRRLAERFPDDMASQQVFLAELVGMGRIAEGDAFVAAMSRVLKSTGLHTAQLEQAWRSVRHRVSTTPAAVLAPQPPAQPEPSPSEPVPHRLIGSERRQVTVLQCGFDTSTQGSAPVDPEELLEALSAYGDHCKERIVRFGGTIATKTSNSILAYFGFPMGYEDNAERALRAAFVVLKDPGEAGTDFAALLAPRIGIATGLVAIKLQGSAGDPDGPVVSGNAPMIAMALRTMADAGQILISDATRKLVGQAVTIASPALTVRINQKEVSAWHVLGVDDRNGRFRPRHPGALRPLIGRDEELQWLCRRWSECLAGDGQVAILSGEAGIGKSRLVVALQASATGGRRRDIVLFCSPLHRATMLHPFKMFLHAAAGIEWDDAPERKCEKLAEYLRLLPGSPPDDLPYFADLLSIPEAFCPRPMLHPQQRRDMTLAAFVRHVTLAASRDPVLLVIEDVHWIDPTSLDLVALIVDRLPSLRILMVLTGRPEFQSPWIASPHVATLLMNRLRPRDGLALIQDVMGGPILPAVVIDQIVRKTDGIPLFIEEVTKAVLQPDLPTDASDAAVADASKRPIAVPATLRDSLTARLDQLGEGKLCAQYGAVIGRDFSYSLLQDLVEGEGVGLDEGLASLERAQLVSRRGTPPFATYSFTHALVQEAAAASLLGRQRQAIHLGIAQKLRDHPDKAGASEPEAIAHHFKEAGQADDAVRWLGKAGEAALRASACREAISLFEEAIGIADRRVETPERRRERVRLQSSYGLALMAGKGYGDTKTIEAFAESRRLADEMDDPSDRCLAYYGLWVGSFVRSQADGLWGLAEQCLQLVADRPVSADASVAHRLCGATLWLRGDFVGARVHLEQAVAIYEIVGEPAPPFRFGQSFGVSALYYLAFVLWPLGEVDRACDLARRALNLAQRLDHLPSLVYAFHHQCTFEAIRADPAAAFTPSKMMVSLSGEHGFPFWQAWGAFLYGWARCHVGETVDGLADMRGARDALDAQGITVWMPIIMMAHAEGVAHAQGPEAALDILDQTQPALRQSGERWLDAELKRLRGELLLACAPPEPIGAEVELAQAIAVACRQKTVMFQLRSAISLARLYMGSGRKPEALAILRGTLSDVPSASDHPEGKVALAMIDAAIEQ